MLKYGQILSKLSSHKEAEKMVSNAVIELKTLISKANQSNKESSSSTKKLYKTLSICLFTLANEQLALKRHRQAMLNFIKVDKLLSRHQPFR